MFFGDLMHLALLGAGLALFVFARNGMPAPLTRLALNQSPGAWNLTFIYVHLHAVLIWGLFLFLVRKDPIETLECSKAICQSTHYGTAQAAFLVWAGLSVLLVRKTHEWARARRQAFDRAPKARIYQFTR